MKKNFKYALLGAIALTGAMTFTACQSSDEIVDNPNYNPETNTVKTEFALNIGTSGNYTRMGATETQQNGITFNGIQDATLLSFSETPDAAKTPIADGKFSLGEITGITADASSKVYTLYIPTLTNNFLFYAKAKTSGQGSERGYIVSTVSTVQSTAEKSTSDITFNLKPISSVTTTFTSSQTTLLGYLNNILKAKVMSGEETTATWFGTQYYAASGTPQQKSDYKALSDAYKDFIKIGSSTIRQGSSVAILRNVQDLYRAAAGVSANPTEVKAIANAVTTAITDNGFKLKDGTSGTTAELEFTSEDASITNFPIEQGLPSGSACLKLSADAKTPTAINDINWDSFAWNNDGKNVLRDVNVNVEKIVYPAELLYFCNSPVITSNTSHAVSDYPVSVGTWDGDWAEGWIKNSTVTANTRAVAMQYNVKYGVGLLQSTIKFGTGIDETPYKLKDNAAAITNGAKDDQVIQFDADDFVWTGILIGGQPDQANWTLLTASESNMSQVIYDNVINTPAITTTASSIPTYTLVLDNYISSEQKDVTVAIEIKNNSRKDFYGHDGVIAAGQTFYLLTKLAAPSETPADWTENDTGVGYPVSKTKRVFAQDFKTIANFTITNEALKEAYSTIPDLRSTQMTFGLSVDLTWKTGLTYNVSF